MQCCTSSGAVYSTISVHRFEDRMVPRFCWLDFALQASLKSMYGVPEKRYITLGQIELDRQV